MWDMSRSPMDDDVTYVISLIVVGIKMITLNNRIKIAVLGSSRVGKTGKFIEVYSGLMVVDSYKYIMIDFN